MAAIEYVAPANSDNNPGTHTYLVGNWSYDNRYGSGCPYDGEGMMLDTLDAHGYKGQIVVRDNIIYRSGLYGLQLFFQNKSQCAVRQYGAEKLSMRAGLKLMRMHLHRTGARGSRSMVHAT